MKAEWCIIVAQIVVGHSKFPHKKVGSFTRYKPWKYQDAEQPHRIIYARSFFATEAEALEKAKQVDQEMFSAYVMGMGDTHWTCVSEFTVILHDVTHNVSRQLSTTTDDDESDNPGFLYSGIVCSNSNLGKWGIIKGLK